MISFQAYQIFYTAACSGSITAAARLLQLTQPTVSHGVQTLEYALGCPLFVRTRKGVSLTPEGRRLYEEIAPACRRIQKAESDFRLRQALAQGQIDLGASEITLRHFLLPYLKAFRQAHPAIRLRLSNSTTPAALEAVRDGGLDCAVLVMEPEQTPPGLEAVPLSSFQDIVLAGPGFARLRERPVSLAELCRFPLIAMAEGTASRSFLAAFFLKHGHTLTPEIETATADLIPPLVETGLGVGFVPSSFAGDAIRKGRVFPVRLKETLPYRQICLVCRQKQPLSAAASAFAALLREKKRPAGAAFPPVPSSP